MSDDLYALFRRSFPYAVRSEPTVKRLLTDNNNKIIGSRGANGRLNGAAVVHDGVILLLCVDTPYRGRGLGTELLAKAEALIRTEGYNSVKIGAGADYLLPGVPTPVPPFPAATGDDKLFPELTNEAVKFLQHRGYRHGWRGANCFDMAMDLSAAKPPNLGGVPVRFALKDDFDAIQRCVDSAEPDFCIYYKDKALYKRKNPRVLVADPGGEVCGAIILGEEDAQTGSLGCTAVARPMQGRGVATALVRHGTWRLRKLGYSRGFIGYTYSGLDRLYGSAGYRVCCYYFMAEKAL